MSTDMDGGEAQMSREDTFTIDVEPRCYVCRMYERLQKLVDGQKKLMENIESMPLGRTRNEQARIARGRDSEIETTQFLVDGMRTGMVACIGESEREPGDTVARWHVHSINDYVSVALECFLDGMQHTDDDEEYDAIKPSTTSVHVPESA